MVITRRHSEGVQNRDAKLTLTWYRGKNQTLSLQGKGSPVLKVKSINLVRSKDPSSAQSVSIPSSDSTKGPSVEIEPEIAKKEIGVQKDLPPDIIMDDNP